jgi:orotidine-5'-phosphate decarboxylase
MTRFSRLPIAIALDGDWKDVKIWTNRLKGKVWGFKIGSILYAERGPRIVEDLKAKGFNVFLDLKFHDIPNTVKFAVRQSFAHGADLLTVHACGGKAMLEAAAAEQKRNQKVVAVTVLTSLSQPDLKSLGVERKLNQQVLKMGKLAMDAGIKGLVCSPQEVQSLRKKYSKAVLVTPGVRFAKGGDDQKRTETPGSALKKGSSLIVLGRALTAAPDWKKAWHKVTSSMAEMS